MVVITPRLFFFHPQAYMSEDVGYSWDASLPIFMHCMIVIPGHTTRALFEDEERDDCDEEVVGLADGIRPDGGYTDERERRYQRRDGLQGRRARGLEVQLDLRAWLYRQRAAR